MLTSVFAPAPVRSAPKRSRRPRPRPPRPPQWRRCRPLPCRRRFAGDLLVKGHPQGASRPLRGLTDRSSNYLCGSSRRARPTTPPRCRACSTSRPGLPSGRRPAHLADGSWRRLPITAYSSSTSAAPVLARHHAIAALGRLAATAGGLPFALSRRFHRQGLRDGAARTGRRQEAHALANRLAAFASCRISYAPEAIERALHMRPGARRPVRRRRLHGHLQAHASATAASMSATRRTSS